MKKKNIKSTEKDITAEINIIIGSINTISDIFKDFIIHLDELKSFINSI